MTPEPVAWVSRSVTPCPGWTLKKRRKNGSCNSGFCSLTRPCTAMLTTPGVISFSIGAIVAAPPLASTGSGAPASAAAGSDSNTKPPINASGAKLNLIRLKTLQT